MPSTPPPTGPRMAEVLGQPALGARPLPVTFESPLRRPLRVALAGSAGQRIRSAGTLLATGAVLAGLWATRRDDYPITVRTGFSLAEVMLAPEPIDYTGIDVPDVALVLAPEGAGRLRGPLARMAPEGRVYVADGMSGIQTPAHVLPLPLPAGARRQARKALSTLAVAALARELDLFPPEALAEAVRRQQQGVARASNLAALAAMA